MRRLSLGSLSLSPEVCCQKEKIMKQKFDIITSTCVPLLLEKVDTDQIIPERFHKATTREEQFFGDNSIYYE